MRLPRGIRSSSAVTKMASWRMNSAVTWWKSVRPGFRPDKTLKHHYARKWDQQFAPSVCVHCALGCNTDAGERYGTLRRIVSRYNHEVNGYFLCDRGRFGYEFVNSERRFRQPVLKGQPTSAALAQSHLREVLANGKAIGIGSPRASLEANFALRTLVGLGIVPTAAWPMTKPGWLDAWSRFCGAVRCGRPPYARSRSAMLCSSWART